LLEAELLDTGFIRGDGRTLDSNTVLLGCIGRVDGDLVIRAVALLDTQVVVLEVDIEVWQNQLLADLLPYDARHFIAIHLNNGVFNRNLCHVRAPYILKSVVYSDNSAGMACDRCIPKTRNQTALRLMGHDTRNRAFKGILRSIQRDFQHSRKLDLVTAGDLSDEHGFDAMRLSDIQ